jgi:serine/threonine-protein kinase
MAGIGLSRTGGQVPAGASPEWIAAAFAGTQLGERYQPVRELGRGGMGVVLLARDRVLHRTVALKLLHPTLALSPKARERFRREARIQAQLAHPGIVAVHGFGEERLPDGRHLAHLVMTHVAGESLAERMTREGRLPAAEVRTVLLALLEALEHAHGEGIVHRDLKPENVLLTRTADGATRVVLTDFGVAARPSHDDPRHGAADVGTPLWMAPEQFAGDHAVDGRTDLHALGAMAYAMLAGRPPFTGASARALAVARMTEAPAPLAPLAPDAPESLVAAVERCLAADREDRWPSARVLRDALLCVELPAWRRRWAEVRAAWRAFRRTRAAEY